MRKKLFEVTTLMYGSSLERVIAAANKVGEVIKVTLEDKPNIVEQNEKNKQIGFVGKGVQKGNDINKANKKSNEKESKHQ